MRTRSVRWKYFKVKTRIFAENMFKGAVLFLLIFSVIDSFGIVIEEPNNVNIQCGSNQIIVINRANWISPYVDRNLWNQFKDIVSPPKQYYCLADQKFIVKAHCHGKRECNFLVDKTPQNTGEDCTQQEKLEIDYDCHTCQTRYPRVRVRKNDNHDFDLINSYF